MDFKFKQVIDTIKEEDLEKISKAFSAIYQDENYYEFVIPGNHYS